MIVFTDTLATQLAADVAAVQVLCAQYLVILIPAFPKTFFEGLQTTRYNSLLLAL